MMTEMTGQLDARPAVPDQVHPALAQVVDLARVLGRDDLAQRVLIAAERASRPATFVAVLGEFKEGKSSLVNALLDRDICPVDDDIATAVITVITHGDIEAVRLHRRSPEGEVVEETTLAALASVVTEQGNPGNSLEIERVTVSLPHPLLAQGITLVDTPGMGGIAAGHAEATLAFLPFADALLFVTDAATELTAPERQWLVAARERCPVVIPVLTKTDVCPDWRRIAELDTAHLGSAGITSTLIPTAASAYMAAIRFGDRDLAVDSGVPKLRQLIASRVVDPARARSRQQAISETRRVVRQLVEAVTLELRSLGTSEEAAAARAEIADATARLAHLRGPGARWGQLLGDRSSDISSEGNFRFRSEMRDLGRVMDERIESLETAIEWDELARTQQVELARSVSGVFAHVEDGFTLLRTQINELIADDLGVDADDSASLDVGRHLADLWQDRQLSVADQNVGVGGKATMVVRSAQSGLMMMGFLGQLLPAAAGALLLSSPITLALAGYFAGKAVLDGRKRAVTMRRSQARQVSRKLIDDVQFEMSNRLSDLVRTRQRDVRDQVTARLAELQRTYAERVTSATSRVDDDKTVRAARLATLKDAHARLKELDGALSAKREVTA
jgi:hypothetical protein